MERPILDAQGNAVGTLELNPAHFDVKPKPYVLHQVVRSQMNNYIKKTANTLTKSQVRGGGKKPFRQKGTGQARAGSRRSPLWRGGAVIFGPRTRVVESKPPKSIRRLAFRMAWSDRFASDAVIILRDLGLDRISTKSLLERITAVGAAGRALIALSESNEVLEKSARNIKPHRKKLYAGKIRSVCVKLVAQVTVYDILLADTILLDEEALKKLQARMEGA